MYSENPSSIILMFFSFIISLLFHMTIHLNNTFWNTIFYISADVPLHKLVSDAS